MMKENVDGNKMNDISTDDIWNNRYANTQSHTQQHSAPLCANFGNQPINLYTKRKAGEHMRKNSSTPLLFNVFNYDVGMMKENVDCQKNSISSKQYGVVNTKKTKLSSSEQTCYGNQPINQDSKRRKAGEDMRTNRKVMKENVDPHNNVVLLHKYDAMNRKKTKL